MEQFADMHVHSTFSSDGVSRMEDYCKNAIQRKVFAICFSDHVDFNSAEKNLDHVKDNRMYNFYTDEYFSEIERLRRKYPTLMLLSGIEFSEPHLFPAIFQKYVELPFDCIIGSIHHCYNSVFPGDGNLSEEQAILEYYDIMIKTIQFGGFQVLAHFDFPKRFYKSWRVDSDIIDQVLFSAIKNDIILEINTSTINAFPFAPMPSLSIIERYIALGGRRVTIGSDAHAVDQLAQNFRKIETELLHKVEIGYIKNRTFFSIN